MWKRALGILVLGAMGCGGEVEREPKSGTDPPADEDPSGIPAPDDGPGDPVPLDECMAGFDRYEEPDRDCNWVVDQLCYEDKLDACACACPGGIVVSTCSSGFPTKNGRVPVYCS